MNFCEIKRSLWASFFVLLSLLPLHSYANLSELASSKTWQALLHSTNNSSAISDANFIISKANFSLLTELESTVELLQKNNKFICQFPARAYWLASKGVLKNPDFNKCPELNEFLRKVPIDDLHLVFSAENLGQPSSMMGHILLKTQGTLNNGQIVDYGITYFTEIDAINLPKTLYQTMFSGSQGYFALGPYEDNLQQYLVREQRNVWEYQLDVNDFEKQLIQLHLWELKSKELEYFFVEYNCATLIHFILALADDSLLETKDWWLTPLDVVKLAHQSDLVTRTNVIASGDWRIRMLSDSISSISARELVDFFDKNLSLPNINTSESEKFLQLELLSSYYDYAKQNELISDSDYRLRVTKVDSLKQHITDYVIELSNYKLPTKTPNDSKATLQYINNNRANELRFRFTPASHHLADDNRQYFSESELNLGEVTLSLEEGSELSLYSFNLYSMTNLTPYHQLTGGISGGFHIRYQPQNISINSTEHFAEVGGKLGITKQLNMDMYLYAVAEVNLSSDLQQLFFTGGPQLGMIVYEVFDMKSVVELSQIYNSGNSNFDYSQLSWQQSWFFDELWQLEFSLLNKWTSSESINEIGFSVQRHF